MNLNASFLSISAPKPSDGLSNDAPVKSVEAPDEKARAQREDFERALQKEMQAKKPQVPGAAPQVAPWLFPQGYVPPSEDDALRVEAAGALEAATKTGTNLVGLRAPLRPSTGGLKIDDLEVAKVAPREASDQPQTAPIVVEAGLPPVQPVVLPSPEEPVHVVDFPQVLTAQVTQMVKDNQPVTQLELEIAPPQIGPVTMQVGLENGAVNVQLVALTMQAKQSLESQVGAIQQILQAHSFTPGQIRVVTAASGKGGAGATGQKNDQNSGFGFSQGGRRRAGGPENMTVGAT